MLVEGVESVVVVCDALDPDVVLFILVVSRIVDDLVMPFRIPSVIVELDQFLQCIDLVILNVGLQGNKLQEKLQHAFA